MAHTLSWRFGAQMQLGSSARNSTNRFESKATVTANSGSSTIPALISHGMPRLSTGAKECGSRSILKQNRLCSGMSASVRGISQRRLGSTLDHTSRKSFSRRAPGLRISCAGHSHAFTSAATGLGDKITASFNAQWVQQAGLRWVVTLVPVIITMLAFLPLKLGLEREVAWAELRATVQMLGVGFLLRHIFEAKSTVPCLLYVVFMVVSAGRLAGQRAKKVPGSHLLSTFIIAIVAFFCLGSMAVLGLFPWEPRFIVTTAGYCVGSTLYVVGQTLQLLQSNVAKDQGQIEAALALGASPSQAISSQVKQTVVVAMGPTFDGHKSIGLVMLPGALSGMVMAGAVPWEAIVWQLECLYLLMASVSGACLLGCALGWRRFFTSTCQLNNEAVAL
eukprot:TRINITY_DN21201_c0_g1_i2.p1 TRINITY_DN21201_c0_g1~~TRINITY_DN21201_c0_g1_i2.p1  ORF type:complete len:391 (+),score=32.53 TRINITY_DN21201_c0_g1_i2:285-1457(+)